MVVSLSIACKISDILISIRMIRKRVNNIYYNSYQKIIFRGSECQFDLFWHFYLTLKQNKSRRSLSFKMQTILKLSLLALTICQLSSVSAQSEDRHHPQLKMEKTVSTKDQGKAFFSHYQCFERHFVDAWVVTIWALCYLTSNFLQISYFSIKMQNMANLTYFILSAHYSFWQL